MSVLTDDEMDTEQLRLFEAWRDLHQRAQRTMCPADAHASGKAYREFHESYLLNTARPSSKVIPFPRRFPDFGGAA